MDQNLKRKPGPARRLTAPDPPQGRLAKVHPAPVGTGGVAAPGISNRLTFLLTRVVSVIVEAALVEFRSLGLSIPAVRVLICLYEVGQELSVGSLAETTSIELSAVSHILRRLEAQKLVTRSRQAQDNRVVHAALTREGRSIAAQCHKSSLRHEALLLGTMPADEVKALKAMLVRIYANARSGVPAAVNQPPGAGDEEPPASGRTKGRDARRKNARKPDVART